MRIDNLEDIPIALNSIQAQRCGVRYRYHASRSQPKYLTTVLPVVRGVDHLGGVRNFGVAAISWHRCVLSPVRVPLIIRWTF